VIIESAMTLKNQLAVVILAAGKGTRMKSETPKVLHKVCGIPMLSHILSAAETLEPSKLIVVVGYGMDEVKREIIPERIDIDWVVQSQQRGTGHALMCCMDSLKDFKGKVLILCGDTPLLDEITLKDFLMGSYQRDSKLSVMTAILENSGKYGRIIRNADQGIRAIIEASDATPDELKIKEINTGNYLINIDILNSLLPMLDNDNSQGEYYLTDIVDIASSKGETVHGIATSNIDSVIGVNNRNDLALVNKIMQKQINEFWMDSGITIIAPDNTYIDKTVKIIGTDTVVYPGSMLVENTIIGSRCVIGLNCVISNSTLGDNVMIEHMSVIEESVIAVGCKIGPFAHLRPETKLGVNVRIGNFVEVKKSSFGEGTKANHLTYIGDAIIGSNINIGAGTITCNYDGYKKHQTEIGDNTFIGSNTSLVAPLKIGKNAVIGAGSTITKKVDDNALAITRAGQRMISGYRERLDKRYEGRE